MRLSGICMLFFLIIAGCATVESNKKPGVDFAQYRKIAVIEFEGPNQAVSREVTDKAAMEFSKKGYDVVRGSQLKSIVGENSMVQAALSESDKSKLKNAGINALINGNVMKYECRNTLSYSASYTSVVTNTCEVSLSMKMLDIASSQILWSANGSLSLGNADGTQQVLQRVLNKISETIP